MTKFRFLLFVFFSLITTNNILICSASNHTYVECSDIQTPVDVVLLIDISSSVSQSVINGDRIFIENIVKSFNINETTVRMAVAIFSFYVKTLLYLNQSKSIADVQETLEMPWYPNGQTFVSKAITELTDKILVQSAGDRIEAPNIVLLVTDAAPTTGDKDATIDAIQELLNASLTSIYIILVTGLQNVPDKDKEAIAQLIKLVGRDHVLDVAQESTSDNKIARNITSVTCTVVDKCKYDWKQQKPCHWDHSDSCQEVLIQVLVTNETGCPTGSHFFSQCKTSECETECSKYPWTEWSPDCACKNPTDILYQNRERPNLPDSIFNPKHCKKIERLQCDCSKTAEIVLMVVVGFLSVIAILVVIMIMCFITIRLQSRQRFNRILKRAGFVVDSDQAHPELAKLALFQRRKELEATRKEETQSVIADLALLEDTRGSLNGKSISAKQNSSLKQSQASEHKKVATKGNSVPAKRNGRDTSFETKSNISTHSYKTNKLIETKGKRAPK